jgi:gamma-glutamyltranspeptidase/glutathione hydrolase
MRLALLFAVSVLTLAGCAAPPAGDPGRPSTASDGASSAREWRLKGRAMAAAADPRAVQAALDVMQAGGSAVDGAIAAHAVLGLVEPQSSGLGGGGFMVVYDRRSNTTKVFDGREAAPATATPDLFSWQGKQLGFGPAVFSGKSVGVPGVVALYKTAHDEYGKLAWKQNFEAAIDLADKGFIVSERLSRSLDNPRFIRGPLGTDPVSQAYFFPEGKPLEPGYRRTNKDYADVLRAVATSGPAAFYAGGIADGIVAAVRSGEIPGELSLKDLADYRVRTAPAVCGPFRSYTICSAPPPSSGGMAMNQLMGLYEAIRSTSAGTGEADRLRDFVMAEQLTYADRDHYVADAAFVTVPMKDLLHPDYIRSRAASGFKPGDKPEPGDPGAVLRQAPIIDMWGRDATTPRAGTTHMSFVDFEGNAVSFTATIEGPFGSSRFTNGFLLNNELTDFSLTPRVNGKPVANAPGPGKRPRSSMSPTIVFDGNGDLFMVTGSPGGNSIIGYVAKTLVAVLDWNRTAQEAAGLPNIVARGQTVRVESTDETGKAWASMLTQAGFKVQEVEGEMSGLHLIVARQSTLEGGADPRKDGAAIEIVKGR